MQHSVKWPWHFHCQVDCYCCRVFCKDVLINIQINKYTFFLAFPTWRNKWQQNGDCLNYICSDLLHIYKNGCPDSSEFDLSYLTLQGCSHICSWTIPLWVSCPACFTDVWYMPHQCLCCSAVLGEHLYPWY